MATVRAYGERTTTMPHCAASQCLASAIRVRRTCRSPSAASLVNAIRLRDACQLSGSPGEEAARYRQALVQTYASLGWQQLLDLRLQDAGRLKERRSRPPRARSPAKEDRHALYGQGAVDVRRLAALDEGGRSEGEEVRGLHLEQRVVVLKGRRWRPRSKAL
eukprot:scaffold31018_cov63-Phaeocystis_antarctica.AAC.22